MSNPPKWIINRHSPSSLLSLRPPPSTSICASEFPQTGVEWIEVRGTWVSKQRGALPVLWRHVAKWTVSNPHAQRFWCNRATYKQPCRRMIQQNEDHWQTTSEHIQVRFEFLCFFCIVLCNLHQNFWIYTKHVHYIWQEFRRIGIRQNVIRRNVIRRTGYKLIWHDQPLISTFWLALHILVSV